MRRFLNLLAGAAAFCADYLQAHGGDVSAITVETSLDSNKTLATTTLKISGDFWLGFGFTCTSCKTEFMNGADPDGVYICHTNENSEWVLERFEIGSNGVENKLSVVPSDEGYCINADGSTTMTIKTEPKNGEVDYTVSTTGTTKAMMAHGDKSGKVGFHRNKFGRLELNYKSGNSPVIVATPLSSMIAVHIALMVLAWILLAPLGIISARYFKRADPTWFHAHRAFVLLAVVFTIVGVALMLSENHSRQGNHYKIGITVLTVSILQPILGAIRPDKESGKRLLWFVAHIFFGILLLVLTCAQMFLGCNLLRDRGYSSTADSVMYTVSISYAIYVVSLFVLELGKRGILPITFVQTTKEVSEIDPKE